MNITAIERGSAMSNSTRIEGKVTRTFPDRGYVWIRGDDGVDYFGHASRLRDDIFNAWVGRPCSFVPNTNGPDNKGPFATDIELTAA